MDNYSKLYWLTRLDSLNTLLAILSILSAIALLFYYLVFIIEGSMWDDDDKAEFKRNWGWVNNLGVTVLAIGIVVLTFLPTKNEVILIYAGGKTMDFVQQDSSINKIPGQTSKVVSDFLDKAIKDLEKKN